MRAYERIKNSLERNRVLAVLERERCTTDEGGTGRDTSEGHGDGDKGGELHIWFV